MARDWRTSDDLPNGNRRPRGDYSGNGAKPLEIEPSIVQKLLDFSLRCNRMPQINLEDPDEIRERVNWYFEQCLKEGLRPGVEGLCNALHINKSTFDRWVSGARRAGQEHQAIAQNAKQILADMMEQYMLSGSINPVAGIFLSSNQFDYDRNATVTVKTQPQLVADEDPVRLAEKYRADVIDVEAEPAKLKIPVRESEK